MHFSNILFASGAFSAIKTLASTPISQPAPGYAPCEQDCHRRMLYSTAYAAAADGITRTMEAYNSWSWCNSADNEDWCPDQLSRTSETIARKIVTNSTLPESCDSACLLEAVLSGSQKAGYWAMDWASEIVNVTLEGGSRNESAIKDLNTTMYALSSLPAGPVVNASALKFAMDEYESQEREQGQDQNGTNVSVAISKRATDSKFAATAASSLWGFMLKDRWQRVVDPYLRESAGKLANMFRGSVNNDGVVHTPWYFRSLFKRFEAYNTRVPYKEYRWHYNKANDMAEVQDIMKQNDIITRVRADTFENAFKEDVAVRTKAEAFAERLFIQETFDAETFEMKTVYLRQAPVEWVKATARRRNAFAREAMKRHGGYRPFVECDPSGTVIKKSPPKLLFHKPADLKPVNNEYWQKVKQEAANAVTGSTDVLMTSEGIVLNSIGEPIVAVESGGGLGAAAGSTFASLTPVVGAAAGPAVRLGSAVFDIAGSAGSLEFNSNASPDDQVKVTDKSTKPDGEKPKNRNLCISGAQRAACLRISLRGSLPSKRQS